MGLKYLHRSAQLTVNIDVLAVGASMPAHNHGIWAVAGVFSGETEEGTFVLGDDGSLQEDHTEKMQPGDVGVLGADAIHASRSLAAIPTISLHVYGGDILASPRFLWTRSGNRRSVTPVPPGSAEETQQMLIEAEDHMLAEGRRPLALMAR
jgi:predicted metal-dependent enzyme (double-stranded beta helix superfamily)